VRAGRAPASGGAGEGGEAGPSGQAVGVVHVIQWIPLRQLLDLSDQRLQGFVLLLSPLTFFSQGSQAGLERFPTGVPLGKETLMQEYPWGRRGTTGLPLGEES
jgi:hypothetical protein